MTRDSIDRLLEPVLKWECYVVTQMATAALGLLPTNCLGFGAVINDLDILLIFHMKKLSKADFIDIEDICDEFDRLMGEEISFHKKIRVDRRFRMMANENIWWAYAARHELRG